MIVRAAEIKIYMSQCHSLKDKRQILRSLQARLRNMFPLSTAEVGLQDKHQLALIGIACVSEQPTLSERILDKALDFMEQEYDIEIIQINEIEASTQ